MFFSSLDEIVEANRQSFTRVTYNRDEKKETKKKSFRSAVIFFVEMFAV